MVDKLKYSVLIVDDDDISQFLINKMISSLGYQSTIVSNGLDAIELLKSTPFDAILMDIEMPIINGFETSKLIRALDNPAINAIPIIGISANPLEIDPKPFTDSGMNDYITKPVHEIDIKQKLDNQLIK